MKTLPTVFKIYIGVRINLSIVLLVRRGGFEFFLCPAGESIGGCNDDHKLYEKKRLRDDDQHGERHVDVSNIFYCDQCQTYTAVEEGKARKHYSGYEV